MSGICGILRFDGVTVCDDDLRRQINALTHLGPDGAHTLCHGPIGLGHLALNITREDLFGSQPLSDDRAALLLVADLRLDNRIELGELLRIDGTSLDQQPDSALLLAAYARWGTDCVDHLLGDFAFALWDGAAGKLMLARDHMGQRHLFYHRGGSFLAFATEIKGLWAVPAVPRALSEIDVGRRILADRQRPAGTTLFEGIEALPGGCIMTVSQDGSTSRRRYWEPHAAAIHLDRDETYYQEAYRQILAEAVACRLRRATKPAALFLSGGFDSTAIAALAAPVLSGRKLIAVASVPPEDEDGAGPGARPWVELCRRDMAHLDIRYVTSDGRSILSGMERCFLAMDGPQSPSAYVTDEMFRTAAAAGARVVMDGHGGDYTLNPRGYAALARLLATGRVRRFCAEFSAQRRHLREPLWQCLKRDFLSVLLPRRVVMAWRGTRAGLAVVGPIQPVAAAFARAAVSRGSVPFGKGRAPHAICVRANFLQVLRHLQDNPTLGGILPGAHGLAFTQPFHDKRVIELALAIPEDLYFKQGRPRYLARTALADLYPAEFQTRRPENVPLIPGFMAMAKRSEPALLAEIERMAKSENLSRYFDFAKMRRMLVQKPGDRRHPGAGIRVRQAMRGFLYARYLDWFNRGNA